MALHPPYKAAMGCKDCQGYFSMVLPLCYIVLDKLDQTMWNIFQDTGTDRLFEREKEEEISIV